MFGFICFVLLNTIDIHIKRTGRIAPIYLRPGSRNVKRGEGAGKQPPSCRCGTFPGENSFKIASLKVTFGAM